MAHEFPSEDWIRAWRRAVEESGEYRERAADWGVEFDGTVLFHVRADDRLPDDHYFFVDLEGGEVGECHAVDGPEAVDHGFVFAGDYGDWVRLVGGEVDAVEGLMGGTFDIEGDLQTVLRYARATAALVDAASEVETEFRY
jgi:putative sterol carrier protein